MPVTDPAERTTTLEELTDSDLGRRVTIARIGGGAGRPAIVGKLVSFHEVTYLRGAIPTRGFVLRIEHERASSSSRSTAEHGPMPASHRVVVGPKWRDRSDYYADDLFD